MHRRREREREKKKKKKKKKKKSFVVSSGEDDSAQRAEQNPENSERRRRDDTTQNNNDFDDEEEENHHAWETYKQNVVSGIREMIEQDVDRAKQSAAEYASEVCGSDSVIAVLGVRDGFVESFLKAAVKKRRVKVIVLETSVSYEENGKTTAEEFARKILNVSTFNSDDDDDDDEQGRYSEH